MTSSHLFSAAAALALMAAPALAQSPDYSVGSGTLYASVKGWSIAKSEQYGCSAYLDAMQIVINAPPAGGWQLIFPYDGADGEFQGSIDVDKYSFTETYFGEAGWMYSSFPLGMRQAVGAGRIIHPMIGPVDEVIPLTGSTAAMLKVEECWKELSGWTPASSRAGTFAFSGD